MSLLSGAAQRLLMLPGLALIACAAPASVTLAQTVAQTAAAPAMAAPPTADTAGTSQYRLTAGDKINITVFGQVDLTGEYVIDGSGNVTMPLAGPIPLADATIKESEQRIATRLSEGYLRQPSVSVRVSELRPIYVVGDVKLPGSYPYRFGSTVLSAVAVAGGYGGAEAVTGTAAAEFLMVDERVRVLERTRLATLVRQARVQAQLDGRDTFDAPVLANPARENSAVDEIVAAERDILGQHIAAFNKEIALQNAQKPRIEAESAALAEQTESQKKQLSLVVEQAEDYAKLDKMGLMRRTTEVTMQREKAALESSISALDAARARLNLMLGELDIKIQDLELAYKRRAMAEMQEVRMKLQEVDTTLPSAREMRELRAQQAGGMASAVAEDAPRSMFVMRTRNNVATTIPATPEMMLQPGDIVEVKRMRPRGLTIGTKPQTSSIELDATPKAKYADTGLPAQ